MPTIAKLFESIVCTILSNHISNVIPPAQHGFMNGRNTITNLLEFTNFANRTLESECQLDVIYTDFQKAFDRVQHCVLLSKLQTLGIHSQVLNWIGSYLMNRSQYVVIAGKKSLTFSVASGVPQGSHLGPILFLMFMWDIPNCIKNARCLMYADDIKLFFPIKNILDASLLQRDLNEL